MSENNGMASADDGTERAPARYTAQGRETIDTMRDRAPAYFMEAALCPGTSLGDASFYVHCRLTADKYRARLGRKEAVDATRDEACAVWYEQMAQHVLGKGPDPRENRPDFVPYKLENQ